MLHYGVEYGYNRRLYGVEQGTYRNSVFSTEFWCEFKTAIKIFINLKTIKSSGFKLRGRRRG